MPYVSNKDLPDSIKNTLPTGAQDIWRNAFNSAAKQTPGDEEKANKIAWGAVKNAGWSKGSGGNWVKSHSELRDIEVFSTGLYKGINWTEADLDNMVTNYHALKDYIKPVLKIAHQNKMHQVDGQPSLGWASELKRIGNKLVATFADVPEMIRKAINKKLYKRVSSEVYSDLNIGGKKYKRVLSGVGLLGADIPVVKNLKDIEVFFADNNQTADIYCMDVNNGVIMTTEETDMSEELKKSFDERLKLLQENHAAQLKKFSEDKDAAIAAKDAEIAEMKAAEAKKESENKIAELKAFCETTVKAGKMVPAARDILIKDIDKMEFAEGQDLSISFDKFKAYIEKTNEVLDKSERGIYKSPDERTSDKKTFAEKPGAILEGIDLDKRTTEIMNEQKCEYEDAMIIALEENAKMMERFSEAGFREEDK